MRIFNRGSKIFITIFFFNMVNIQGVSRLVDIIAGGDFLGLCYQKSSYKHLSDFGITDIF